MYKIFLLILILLSILVIRINADVLQEHRPISSNFSDLYSQCDVHGGHRLCLGTVARENDNFKYSKSECVWSKNCLMLFQFEITEPDFPNAEDTASTGTHCLYFDNEYKKRTLKQFPRDETVLIGVRFGYEPSSPKLESGCFLDKSTDFLQIFYYTDRVKRKFERMKNGPAFDPAVVTYDNRPVNSELIYCCFKQPLRIKMPDVPPFDTSKEREIILDKKVYISTYYRIGDFNNTLKSEQPISLLDYRKRDIKTLPTTISTTTTTTTSSTTPTSSSEAVSSDSELTSSTVRPIVPTQPYSVDQPDEIQVDPIKSEEVARSGTSKALIIFIISIVLLVFFLLIAVTIYNLLMKGN